MAEVKENHLRDAYNSNPIIIETRCLVTKVHKFNPYETYSLKQLHRRLDRYKDGNKGICFDSKFLENVSIFHYNKYWWGWHAWPSSYLA